MDTDGHRSKKENSSANCANDREWTCLGSHSRKFAQLADRIFIRVHPRFQLTVHHHLAVGIDGDFFGSVRDGAGGGLAAGPANSDLSGCRSGCRKGFLFRFGLEPGGRRDSDVQLPVGRSNDSLLACTHTARFHLSFGNRDFPAKCRPCWKARSSLGRRRSSVCRWRLSLWPPIGRCFSVISSAGTIPTM